jgi:hypothetical protein
MRRQTVAVMPSCRGWCRLGALLLDLDRFVALVETNGVDRVPEQEQRNRQREREQQGCRRSERKARHESDEHDEARRNGRCARSCADDRMGGINRWDRRRRAVRKLVQRETSRGVRLHGDEEVVRAACPAADLARPIVGARVTPHRPRTGGLCANACATLDRDRRVRMGSMERASRAATRARDRSRGRPVGRRRRYAGAWTASGSVGAGSTCSDSTCSGSTKPRSSNRSASVLAQINTNATGNPGK